MRYAKQTGKLGILAGVGLISISLAGCAETPEDVVVRPKGAAQIESYKEASDSESQKADETAGADSQASDTAKEEYPVGSGLYEVVGASERYRDSFSDDSGKIKIEIDAEVDMPKASKVPAVYVRQHPIDTELMERITKAFFGDADVYEAEAYTVRTKDEWQEEIERLKGYVAVGNLDPEEWGTDDNGNYFYDIYGRIEQAEEAYKTAPESREIAIVKPPYSLKEMNFGAMFLPESRFYGIVPMGEGSCYRYEMTQMDALPLKVYVQQIGDAGRVSESLSEFWQQYELTKHIKFYDWLPEREEFAEWVGISVEDAKKMADERVAGLNLEGMEMYSWEYAYKVGGSYSVAAKLENLIHTGYCFHYTRKLDGIPITYTDASVITEAQQDSEIKPWVYERLNIYVTKDGVDEIGFTDPYDIGETKVENLELMPFSEIMQIFEKMIRIKYADIFVDRSAEGTEIGSPPAGMIVKIDRITFGYARIYDPQAGDQAGLLVPVWDFFGGSETDYGEDSQLLIGQIEARYNPNSTFLTINAVDGTIIDRWRGY